MAEYEKKVRDELSRNGCHFVRHGKGDHDISTGVVVLIQQREQLGAAADVDLLQLLAEHGEQVASRNHTRQRLDKRPLTSV